jgi:TPR repeat protein
MKKLIFTSFVLYLLVGCVSNENKKPQEYNGGKIVVTQIENVETAETQFQSGKKLFDNKLYTEAIQLFIEASEQGSSKAQAYLGMIFSSNGYGVKQDYQKSAYWYKKAAKNGDVMAQFNIAGLYRNGISGFPQSSVQAAKWYLKAAEQGDPIAQSIIGAMLGHGEGVQQNYAEAIKWHQKSVKQQHDLQDRSQFSLGVAYNQGIYVSKDVERAIYWFKKAAEQGHVRSQLSLGMIYSDKFKDFKKAIEWYLKAAKQGDDGAQFFVGLHFEFGKGVKCDYKKALEWYSKAAKQDHTQAQENIVKINKKITDLKKLFESAEQGDVWAPYELGVKYYFEQGVCQDYKKAVYWFEKAAKVAAMAPYYLGEIYYYGKGRVFQNYKKAANWYKIAANDDIKWAQAQLGDMYYFGDGVTQNYKLAYVWESLAAANGIETAKKVRDMIAKKITPQQLIKTQELAAKIRYNIDHRSESKKPSISNTEKKINSSGTGFIITRDGYILTCHHVIASAKEIKIIAGGNTYSAKLVRDDPNNDLALLKINGNFSAIGFSSKRSAKMGQEVFTIGYPNPGLQGVSAKFTEGTISSLTGFQDDLRLYQISIPVQPGNSGGALLDVNGNILGVIMAMLDAKTTFKISGSLPQNVNYAVKSIYAQAMLDTLPEISDRLIKPARSKSDAVDRVGNSTVMILSYQ